MESTPLISIVMLAYGDESALTDSVRSVLGQTFSEWELLLVCSGSGCPISEIDGMDVAVDGRVRVITVEEGAGCGAAWNAGLRHAAGRIVAYLLEGDAFYPDHLEHVAQFADRADVLLFSYDVPAMPGPPLVPAHRRDPASLRANLFAMPIAEPLAVVHSRAWAENAGAFNELLWREEHWEFWKRLAQAGAQFVFVPLCSGRRSDAAPARPLHLTRRHRDTFEANWRAGRPIYGDTTAGVARKPVQKVAFLSPYCLLDHTSGAAIATRSALQLLANSGFQARAFCGSWRDAPPRDSSEKDFLQVTSDCHGNVETTVFPIGTGRYAVADPPQVTAFYQACSAFLDSYRPDAILTYGGDPVSQTLVSLARNRDIPVVFALKNFSYWNVQAFTDVDYIFVPSEYSRRTWWDSFGMACHLLPNVIDPERVLAADRKPECVTFVNPEMAKGGFVFARIAEQLARRRPDIPLLVVQGRSQDGSLEQTQVDLSGANLQVIDSTADPRTFYARTKLLLMPSLCNESFGLTAAEAMLNGIPVLASNRGALPETVGDGGFLFDIPACYTPQTHDVPTADQVEPWLATILRLWDTPDAYHAASTAAVHRAQAWLPDRLAPTYQAFFSNLHPQPGPPYMPTPPDSP